MQSLFMFLFFSSILAGLYFLVRLIISFIRKDDNCKKYGKFLVACIAVFLASSIGAAKNHEATNSEITQPQNIVEEFTFPAPEELGEIDINFKTGKLIFTGATQSNENSATFGEGEDTLYVQGVLGNNNVSVNVGGKDINNTFPIDTPLSVKIYKTSTNDGTRIYILKRAYDMDCDYLIIGRKLDGTFVKYIDTKELTLKYFGNQEKRTTIVYDDKVLIKGSTLSFNCFRYKFGEKNFPGDKVCRFNFKWNDYTQSFDIEQTDQQSQEKTTQKVTLPQNNNNGNSSNEVYVGTYSSGLKAYLLANTFKMKNHRNFSVTIKAIDDKGNVQYVDYTFSGASAGPDYWKNSQGYSGEVNLNMPSVETNIRKYSFEKMN